MSFALFSFAWALEVPVSGAMTDAAGAPLTGTRAVIFHLLADQDHDGAPEAEVHTESATVQFAAGGFAAALHPAAGDLSSGDALGLAVEITGIGTSAPASVGWAPRAVWAEQAGRLGDLAPGDVITWSDVLGTENLIGTYDEALDFPNPLNHFVGDGADLRDLNANQLTSGTVPGARLGGTYGNAITLSNAGNVLAGDGAAITGINASSLGTGTLAAARLPASVVRTDVTAPQAFTGPIGLGNVTQLSCSGATEGAIAYNYTAHRLEYCNGSAMQPVGATTSPVRQFKHSHTSAALNLAAIPWDGSIPQISEGGQVATVTITPTAAGNALLLEGVVVWSEPANTANHFTVSLFRQGTANALASTGDSPMNDTGGCGFANGYDYVCTTPIRFVFTSTGTAAETFELRAGLDGGTTYLNRAYNGASQGGTMTSGLTVTEYAP